MKRFFIATTIVLLVIFVLAVQNMPTSVNTTSLTIGKTEVNAEILNTHTERVRGLSGREKLESDNVLLFVFEEEDFHSIWMKDMNFPIDIIWLDTNLEIIHIEERVSPDTYPKVFYPSTKSLYVIETVSNFVLEHGIKIGDKVSF